MEHYRNAASELAKACRSGDTAIHTWAEQWIARLLEHQTDVAESTRGDAQRRARQISDFARDRLRPTDCALAEAELVVARAHGFLSWPTLMHHIEGLADSESDVSVFELAADVIVAGDLAALEQLLATHPRLVHERSTREHRGTLLHYVSANGVENYRQKTPLNIVTIARRLLDAGADVNAVADVYGGNSTTLGLVVTSAHPRQAGVQNALAELLLERGARVDADIVRSCLMNGCPEAAAHLADRGAPVNLEEAAGLGRLDSVARRFEPPNTVSAADAGAALLMACWYDQREVVTFLLDHGVDVAARSPKDGDTALHIAAYRGNPTLVELLLKREAPVNVRDAVHGTPPLVWALHAWLVERRTDDERYSRIVRMLVDAGAEVKQEWLDDDRLRADADLYTALLRRAQP